MIVICREITPTLQEVMKEIINMSEASNTIISTKTLALFTSHGTEHFKKDITLYESLSRIFQRQLDKYAEIEEPEQPETDALPKKGSIKSLSDKNQIQAEEFSI